MIHVAALAGLLHDVGKFWQRTSTHGIHPNYRHFTKEDYGTNGAHATFSSAYIEEFVPQAFRNEVNSAVLYHHRPQDALSRLIALADRLAASSERSGSETESPQHLLSVFSKIGNGQAPQQYVPLRSLKLSPDHLFPSGDAPNDRETKEKYAQLWRDFEAASKALTSETDETVYIESLLALMQQYTWCIPSAYWRSEPDISLYDHSRMTAALAACLSVYPDEKIAEMLESLARGEPTKTSTALLVEGDISGIQRFIYQITSRGAAQMLRARSLYLQVLTEAAARYVLRELGLTSTNLIYAGGGHFYLLAPPTAFSELERIREYLVRTLLTHHDGDLFLAMGWTSLGLNQPFFEGWKTLKRITSEDKRRRYGFMTANDLHRDVFAPRGWSSNDELGLRREEREEQLNEEEPTRSVFNSSLIELGRKLPQAAFIVLTEHEPKTTTAAGFESVLAHLGTGLRLMDDDHTTVLASSLQIPVKRAVVLGMEDFPPDSLRKKEAQRLGVPVAASARYVVNVTPRDKSGNTVTFDNLQQVSAGIKRLGVLRMDVDDLGTLFRDVSGIGTVTRIASLSFNLSLFFEGWIGNLCREINRTTTRQDNEVIYTVYSGGDDLFIVGSWDVLPGLAHRIRQDLRRFAAQNPSVHISAGITLHGGKYPLYQAAEDALDALETAKELPGKDALNFMHENVRWSEWQKLVELRDELQEIISSPRVGRSLLQSLLGFYLDYKQALDGAQVNRTGQSQIVWGPWLWRSAYQFARLAERSDNKAAVMRFYEKLKENQFQGLALSGIAARWVEALTRQDKERVE